MGVEFEHIEGVRIGLCPKCGETAEVIVKFTLYWDHSWEPGETLYREYRHCMACGHHTQWMG